VKTIYKEITKVEGCEDIFWGYNVEVPGKVELLVCDFPRLMIFSEKWSTSRSHLVVVAESVSPSAKSTGLSQISATTPSHSASRLQIGNLCSSVEGH
jgi:hypothetical protein